MGITCLKSDFPIVFFLAKGLKVSIPITLFLGVSAGAVFRSWGCKSESGSTLPKHTYILTTLAF